MGIMQGFDIVQRAETTQKALEARVGFMRGRFWGRVHQMSV
jgi:hypothetical protein